MAYQFLLCEVIIRNAIPAGWDGSPLRATLYPPPSIVPKDYVITGTQLGGER